MNDSHDTLRAAQSNIEKLISEIYASPGFKAQAHRKVYGYFRRYFTDSVMSNSFAEDAIGAAVTKTLSLVRSGETSLLAVGDKGAPKTKGDVERYLLKAIDNELVSKKRKWVYTDSSGKHAIRERMLHDEIGEYDDLADYVSDVPNPLAQDIDKFLVERGFNDEEQSLLKSRMAGMTWAEAGELVSCTADYARKKIARAVKRLELSPEEINNLSS